VKLKRKILNEKSHGGASKRIRLTIWEQGNSRLQILEKKKKGAMRRSTLDVRGNAAKIWEVDPETQGRIETDMFRGRGGDIRADQEGSANWGE